MSPIRLKPLVIAGLSAVFVLAVVLVAKVRYDVDVPLVDEVVENEIPVLLVHGYGGGPESMSVLERLLQEQDRRVVSVALPGSGRGDIVASARALDEVIAAEGTPWVDVVGFSAGGLVARTLVLQEGDDGNVRFLVSLGTPHHGTRLAGLATAFDPSLCARACWQMIPGSRFLRKLNSRGDEPPRASVTSIFSADDGVVNPPGSARLRWAQNIRIQDVCPNAHVPHARLVTEPVAIGLVVAALNGGPGEIDPTSCDDVRQLGTVPEN
ncbi:MAG: alpha/beta fold hydrolase [Actinomycetota bacterium]|nr:alpha/beta fold hydrolase [Actinomycetota bacterium]